MIQRILKGYIEILKNRKVEREKKQWYAEGQIPWSKGYIWAKEEKIKQAINNLQLISSIKEKTLPDNYGFRIDERIVEYPWLISNLSNSSTKLLDAGSTFNFEYIVSNQLISQKELSIYTFYPEEVAFFDRRINYVYGDLRNLPFKDSLFDEIVCQSTIEHIDMNNSMYGYDLESAQSTTSKNYEYLKVIDELLRVLTNSGSLLLTFPFGKYENHGFFQQFDEEMVSHIREKMIRKGIIEETYFQYLNQGWIFSNNLACNQEESFNPHTNKGKKADMAAHCRSICCIKFIKI